MVESVLFGKCMLLVFRYLQSLQSEWNHLEERISNCVKVTKEKANVGKVHKIALLCFLSCFYLTKNK